MVWLRSLCDAKVLYSDDEFTSYELCWTNDNLCIPCDHNDGLDPQGLRVANIDPLRIPDALYAQDMPNAPKHLIQKLGLVDSSNFRLSSFTTNMKDEHLMNDSLTSIEQFYAPVNFFLKQQIRRTWTSFLNYQSYLIWILSVLQSCHHLHMQNMAMLKHAMTALVSSLSTLFARMNRPKKHL